MKPIKRSSALIFGILALGVWVRGEPEQLVSFGKVFGALESGARVRVVLRYKNMTLYDENGELVKEVPDAVGGMDLDTFEYFAAGAIGNPEGYFASSHAHLINHPRYGVVLNYVKISVYESGQVKIRAQYLSPTDYAVKMDETFETKIHDGENGAGAYFFKAAGTQM
jgi:hypothetical protein